MEKLIEGKSTPSLLVPRYCCGNEILKLDMISLDNGMLLNGRAVVEVVSKTAVVLDNTTLVLCGQTMQLIEMDISGTLESVFARVTTLVDGGLPLALVRTDLPGTVVRAT
jgi:hypothetical protein